jgi:hypothetical protein
MPKGRKTLYQVLVGAKTSVGPKAKTHAMVQGSFGTRVEAMDVAKGYRESHPKKIVGVFRSTRLKVWGYPRRRRGRIVRG